MNKEEVIRCPFENKEECFSRYNPRTDEHDQYCRCLKETSPAWNTCPFYKRGGAGAYSEMLDKTHTYALTHRGETSERRRPHYARAKENSVTN